VNRFCNRNGKRKGSIGKHLPAWDEKAMEINRADVAELVDARDLKSHGATDATNNSCLTPAYSPIETGADPAGLSNTASSIITAILIGDDTTQAGAIVSRGPVARVRFVPSATWARLERYRGTTLPS
jgi:hypothetical protein